MNREDLKKRLREQTENLIPDMQESILSKMDKVEIMPYHKVEKSKASKRFVLRKILTAAGLSLILVISGVLGFVLNNDNNRPVNDSYIYISINPKVELVSDNNNQIKSARGLNKDGILLLAGEKMIGMDTNIACKRVVTLADRMGYLTNGHKVSISVVSNNAKNETLVENLIKEEFINEADIKLELASENNSEDIQKIAKDKKTTVNKVILAQAAMELDPDLTIDNALLLDTSRLFELVANANEVILDKISDYVQESYEENEELKAISEKITNKEKEIEDFTAEIDLLLSDFDEEKFFSFAAEKELTTGIFDTDAEDYLDQLKAFVEEYKADRLEELNKELEDLRIEQIEIEDALKLELRAKIDEEITDSEVEEETEESLETEIEEESEEITNKTE